MRRRTALGLLASGLFLDALAQAPAPRIVAISARKFEFTPAEVTLKAGEPVVLVLTAEDVEMGFSLPELKLQADIPPGKPARLAFTPQRPGQYEYHCDVFCGEGHEDMTGVIKVIA
ncbi:MAG TPA: cupredoxin domain-containing protein [Burkholderiales bacterium]